VTEEIHFSNTGRGRRLNTVLTHFDTTKLVSQWVGAAMKCLACGAEMRLMDVRADTTTPFGIERRVFQCLSCRQIAQRLMLNRVRMPIINLPVVITPTDPPATQLQMGRRAAPNARVNAIDKVNIPQAALKEQAAEAEKTPDWGSAVEKLSVALKAQATAVRASNWARTVEKLRSRQMALKERAATARTVDREFDHVWTGQNPDRPARKPVAQAPELRDGGAI
jgi:hypothetical protein